jgi:hypothetical protein
MKPRRGRQTLKDRAVVQMRSDKLRFDDASVRSDIASQRGKQALARIMPEQVSQTALGMSDQFRFSSKSQAFHCCPAESY